MHFKPEILDLYEALKVASPIKGVALCSSSKLLPTVLFGIQSMVDAYDRRARQA